MNFGIVAYSAAYATGREHIVELKELHYCQAMMRCRVFPMGGEISVFVHRLA